MTGETRTKINHLLRVWPQGTVALSRWLEKHGAYQQLVHAYEQGRWIRRIGHGAYVRAGDTVEWTGGLYAIQELRGLPVHAGAKTALQMQWSAHSPPLAKSGTVSLFGAPGTRFPMWFRRYEWGVKLRYTTTRLFASDPRAGLTRKELGAYAITVSAPERAIMEVSYLVPVEESFEEAGLLMAGLTTLRPRLVQALLEQCRSVKVKRLFMFLAEACDHGWVERLDLSRVDFGRGKRMIVKGGRFDAKYGITVPKNFGARAIAHKPGVYPIAQAGRVKMAAAEKNTRYSAKAMTQAEGVAFKARWAMVEAAERDELRATPMDKKVRQLAALMASVEKLGWDQALADEEHMAREQWRRLRGAYGV